MKQTLPLFLMLLAAVVGIIMVIVMATNGTMVGEDIIINESVKTPIAIRPRKPVLSRSPCMNA